MKLYEPLVLLLGLLSQILGTRITLDDDAQALCKKYKMVCKTGKVCAVQHFDVPRHITIPVCIPLSFVPVTYKGYVRNLICQLPADPGRCYARYIRWYYNIHSRGCTHFRYGGCHGNQNNFMSKAECEKSCLATPSIKLFEGGQSALVQMKPSIMTAPVYEPPQTNSIMYSASEKARDRYRVARHRSNNKNQSDEANTRKRRRLDREKEKRRRERRKEKKRLKRLRQRQRNLKKGKKSKKDRKNKKNKKKDKDRISAEVVDEVTKDEDNGDVVMKDATAPDAETEEKAVVASNELAGADDDSTDGETEENAEKERKRKRKKRRNKDRKKREKYRSRRHRPSYKRYGELKAGKTGVFSILDGEASEAR